MVKFQIINLILARIIWSICRWCSGSCSAIR